MLPQKIQIWYPEKEESIGSVLLLSSYSNDRSSKMEVFIRLKLKLPNSMCALQNHIKYYPTTF